MQLSPRDSVGTSVQPAIRAIAFAIDATICAITIAFKASSPTVTTVVTCDVGTPIKSLLYSIPSDIGTAFNSITTTINMLGGTIATRGRLVAARSPIPAIVDSISTPVQFIFYSITFAI
jgi:hypothetical protein